MFKWIRKRLALRSYRRKLGPALLARYGRAKHYSVNQIRVTADKLGLDTDYICYAYACFSERAAFEEHHVMLGESCDWGAMRSEVLQSPFGNESHPLEIMAEYPTDDFTAPDHHHGGHHDDFGGGDP